MPGIYLFNPSSLPAPIEWVNKKRVRVKDAFTKLGEEGKEIIRTLAVKLFFLLLGNSCSATIFL